jgi:hypothetical protein
MAHMRKERKRISRYAPFGWNLDSAGVALVPNAAEQEHVARMRTLRASGLSYRDVARSLDVAGIPTKTGTGAWTAKVVRSVLNRKSA